MKTFEKDTHCFFGTEELYRAAFNYAKSKGVPVQNNLLRDYSQHQYPRLLYSYGYIGGYVNDIDFGNEITIAQFFEYCDNWEKCKPVELQLNDEYKAVVNKEDKTVKVGCQYFSFDKINELHKLINQ